MTFFAARKIIVPLALLCSAPVTAAMAGGCTIDFSSGSDVFDARLQEVNKQDGSHFIANDTSKGCPSQAATCQTDSRVIKGDRVVVAHVQGDYACAIYLDKPPRIASGWLPVSTLADVQPDINWAGQWTSTVLDDQIAIEQKSDGTIEIKGTVGSGQAEPAFAASVRPDGATAKLGYDRTGATQLSFEQAAGQTGQCTVKLKQLGRYLAVQDNGNCGGLNNSFSGVYLSVNAKPAKAATADASGLRPSYTACLDASGGVTSEMQDCIGAEHEYQDARLNKVYKALRDRLDQQGKRKLLGEQRKWLALRDKSCEADADGGTGQMLEANDCALEMTAKRAAELESR